jgi:hypothetical protein
MQSYHAIIKDPSAEILVGSSVDRIGGSRKGTKGSITMLSAGPAAQQILDSNILLRGRSVIIRPYKNVAGQLDFDISKYSDNSAVQYSAEIRAYDIAGEQESIFYVSQSGGSFSGTVDTWAVRLTIGSAHTSKDGRHIIIELLDQNLFDQDLQTNTIPGYGMALRLTTGGIESDGRITAQHSAALVPVTTFRVDVIFKLNVLFPSVANIIMIKGDTLAGVLGEWSILASAGGSWRARIIDNLNSPVQSTADSPIAVIGGTHHLTMYWDGSKIYLVVDGVLQSQQTSFTSPYIGKTGQLSFGREIDGERPAEIDIYTARIYTNPGVVDIDSITGEAFRFAGDSDPDIEYMMNEAFGGFSVNRVDPSSDTLTISNASGPWDPWVYGGKGNILSSGEKWPARYGHYTGDVIWGERRIDNPAAHLNDPTIGASLDWVRSGGIQLQPLKTVIHTAEMGTLADGTTFLQQKQHTSKSIPPYAEFAPGRNVEITAPPALAGTYLVDHVSRGFQPNYGRIIYFDGSTPLPTVSGDQSVTIKNETGDYDYYTEPGAVIRFTALPTGRILHRAWSGLKINPPPAEAVMPNIGDIIEEVIWHAGITGWNRTAFDQRYVNYEVGYDATSVTIRKALDEIVQSLGPAVSYITTGIDQFSITEMSVPDQLQPPDYDLREFQDIRSIELVREIAPFRSFNVRYKITDYYYTEGELFGSYLSTATSDELADITKEYLSASNDPSRLPAAISGDLSLDVYTFNSYLYWPGKAGRVANTAADFFGVPILIYKIETGRQIMSAKPGLSTAKITHGSFAATSSGRVGVVTGITLGNNAVYIAMEKP